MVYLGKQSKNAWNVVFRRKIRQHVKKGLTGLTSKW